MNWKNITLENGCVKQEISINGMNAKNYIPFDQIDSFGIVSSENKLWLYAGVFFGVAGLLCLFAGAVQPMFFCGLLCAALIGIYFFTRKTWLSIHSNQTKFSVEVMTNETEIKAVTHFVEEIKNRILTIQASHLSKVA